MSHFAKVENGIVTQVIVAEQDFINLGYVGDPKDWIQTSYNTRGGVHYKPDTGEPSEDQSKALRGNYAGIGYTYDEVNDVFYEPKPYPSWSINTKTWLWEAPIPKPAQDKAYIWDELTLSWIEVTFGDINGN